MKLVSYIFVSTCTVLFGLVLFVVLYMLAFLPLWGVGFGSVGPVDTKLLLIFSVVVGLLYLVAVRAVVKSSLLRYYKTWPHALLYFVCVPIGLGLLYMAVAILLE